jgi:hypothetical protein
VVQRTAVGKRLIPAGSAWLGGCSGLGKQDGMSANSRGGLVMDGEQRGRLSPTSSWATLAMAKFPHRRRTEKGAAPGLL